ncbi:hypothetical protein C8R48DRAFT_767573 [Suillus tomentosus]|nr:hypothetical protein C8R48DRAFT_767573 [Suillus tomentosus]
MDPDTVKQAVYDTWSEDITRFDLGEILSKSEIPENAIQYHIWQFINLITIERLDFKISGGLPLPRYNIFAKSPTSDPETWKNLREYIHSLSYPSDLDGCGTAVYFIPCTLCHSIAHPRASALSQISHSGTAPSTREPPPLPNREEEAEDEEGAHTLRPHMNIVNSNFQSFCHINHRYMLHLQLPTYSTNPHPSTYST